MNPIIPVFVFSVSAVLASFLKKEKQIFASSVVLAVLGSAATWLVTLPVLTNFSIKWFDNLWLVDSFSALIASLVALVYLAATIVSVRYIAHEYEEKIITLNDLHLYFTLLHIFALCMLVTVLANNTLLLWLALEGTTLSSTFLVGLYRRKTSMEAAWKYIIICSTGISLGLVGILLLNYSVSLVAAKGSNFFLLTTFLEHAKLLSPEIVRWAFVFLFVGFGAKVGMVPMHTWLPDAHSKAPSPISGLFSGILLNVALYAIVRFKFVADSALGQTQWTGKMFLFFGLVSILLPALMMLVQKNYKRMLAYSSVEHMGIITFALALSPIGAVAAVMHMIGHTFTKSLLFFGAGEILIKCKTTDTEKVGNLFEKAPFTAILFLLGILAIVALPPSALFVSEFAMLTDSFKLHPFLSLLILVALSTIAYAMLKSTLGMLFGKNEEEIEQKKEKWNITHWVMMLQLVAVVILAAWFSSANGLAFIENIVRDSIFISIN